MSVCRYCEAIKVPEFCNESHHNPPVAALARALAEKIHETTQPTDEQVSWFIEDADAVAAQWSADVMVTVEDHGFLADERRHFTINGERWASADPNAEGFNPLEPMAPCPHPYLEPGDECEECHGSGWWSAWAAEESEREADR